MLEDVSARGRLNSPLATGGMTGMESEKPGERIDSRRALFISTQVADRRSGTTAAH